MKNWKSLPYYALFLVLFVGGTTSGDFSLIPDEKEKKKPHAIFSQTAVEITNLTPIQPAGVSRSIVKSIFDKQIGVRERTGNNDGKEVERYLQHVGLTKGYAWCAAFVCWVYSQAGITNPKSAWCPAMFPKKNIIYQRNDKNRQGTPQCADTFGIWFNSYKRVAHVGLIDEWSNGSYFISVEGNTNNTDSRDGDGVYRKRRLKTQVYQVSDFISQ